MNPFLVNDIDLVTQKKFTLEEVAKKIGTDKMNISYFLSKSKILSKNGKAMKILIEDGYCISKRKKFGEYETFFTEIGIVYLQGRWEHRYSTGIFHYP